MAVIAKQRYKLDIAPKGGWVIVYASQHDDGAREIEFEITNQGNVFSIPASINVSVQGIKSNGGYFSHSCSYSGNVVTMALADDMTDVVGKAICVLKFTNSSQQKLATAKFILNVDSDSSSEGIIVDIDAEEIFNQMLNEIRAQAASVSADIAELQSMVGSPLVASTASAMTNHNKIYVYTGSESGYTNGNWYYWNGSAWTSGGVYNSTAFETDTTLTISGMAADAKATGELSAYTRNIAKAETGRYSGNLSTGKISRNDSNGNIFGLSKKVPCKANTRYTATFSISAYASLYVLYYAQDESFLNYENFVLLKTAIFTTPQNAAYVYVYAYRSVGGGLQLDDTSTIQIEEGSASTEYIPPVVANDVQARQGGILDVSYEEWAGYFRENGSIGGASENENEKYTKKIDITLFKSFGYSLQYTEARALWVAICTYDRDGVFIKRVIHQNTSAARTELLIFDNNVKYVAFSYRKFIDGVFKLYGTINDQSVLARIMDNSEKESCLDLPLRFKPCYDHLFVTQDMPYITIPHESLYHVRISRLLGFNTIEANIGKTSDGVFIVNHLVQGKFGGYFHHVDGVTDISNMLVSSVTWDWIVANVRYNSTIPKYRTKPTRLEEFLSECRQQNIIPFVYSADSDVIKIVDAYMGKNNYIAYGATREDCPSAIIYQWADLTTKDSIIERCKKTGKPFIYGMSNPTAFTDAELLDIIKSLHDLGYWIGLSYVDSEWYKYSAMGFDINGTQYLANRLESGNVYNYDTIFGFNNFTYTNATESDGTLIFSSDGVVTPNVDDTTVGLGIVDVEVVYSGTINFVSVGISRALSITSDGSSPVFIASPIVNGTLKPEMRVTSGTVIYDIKCKASIA